jgi:hypothetical protein
MIAGAGRLPAIVVLNYAALTWKEANEPSDDAVFLSGRVHGSRGKASLTAKFSKQGPMRGRLDPRQDFLFSTIPSLNQRLPQARTQ